MVMPSILDVNYFERIYGLNHTFSDRYILGEIYVYNEGKYITDENATLRVQRAIQHLAQSTDCNHDSLFITHLPLLDQPLTNIVVDANDQITAANKIIYLVAKK